MTREEIMKLNTDYLNDCESEHEMNEMFYYLLQLQEHEQQPCTEAISRQDTLNAIIKRLGISDEKYLLESERAIYQQILAMPPVTPQPKTGHWILSSDYDYEYCTCSECGYQNGENWMIGSQIKFCSNCGAKMQAKSDHKCHNCKHYTSGERDGNCDSYICKHYSGWESEEI